MDEATDGFLRARDWQEDDLLRELREDLEARGPAIRVSPETGRLLATIVRAHRGIRRVHELIAEDRAWDSTVLPVGDGVSVSVRRG